MTGNDPDVDKLKDRQRAQEELAREALERAVTPADAAKQSRRADKARYLREKLQEREAAETDATGADD